MRQAGRYLPEYREVRKKMGGFLDLCYSPEQACEVTLQPVRRFGMDAAIIFSDILVIPDAMGCDVRFVTGEGPQMTPVQSMDSLEKLQKNHTLVTEYLAPVYEALRLTRAALPGETALIGFAGAPWTIACYMLQGRGGGQFGAAREMVYRSPELVVRLVDQLSEMIALHLIEQIRAGAQAVQLFDSWSGLVPAGWIGPLVMEPAKRIVAMVREACPQVPVIGFPRGLGMAIPDYVDYTGIDGVSVDTSTPIELVREIIPEKCVVQGNLDPLLLLHDKEGACREVARLMEVMEGKRFIMNLGHGVIKETPPEHVQAIAEMIKGTE